MPIYEYRCADCDRSFEALVRPNDPLTHCPHCNGSTFRRELSVFTSGVPSSAADAPPTMVKGGGGGGCCGGACGCG
jgi:putative FmdB family regulatory protein